MSSRLRNMIVVFAVSIMMWAGLLHGTLALYAGFSGSSTDTMTTASVDK
ncbi:MULTISPECIES: hypothetical protein [Rhizobiaceae]|uniref:Uncharacterized protein n=1 Tax=Aliirhizobium cellulosilyticum TaxID=393664 RepID=A0A7W6SAQ5_9HYPH|nr:hypothetical protein [Rhizobium cellulosilyticum]MBB4350336.1 hypothetical protein [Rhizobium cellulosilyticum]MBB4413632.1 hypothetical protein [Rhizobium cellulosilyticum]MBB4448265.1 hypothetical protein [Rhizobium cellulosilyticum]